MVKIRPLLLELRNILAAAGIENARREAALILCHCTGIPAGRLALEEDWDVTGEVARQAGEMARRRALREPLQYVLGEWDFLGRRILVRPGVLIPRPETELLVEYALSRIEGRQARVLDLCCGSGCISVSLAALGDATVTAGDISPEALTLTAQNAALWEVVERVATARIDALSPWEGRREFDMLVCNPPYIPTEELPRLQREVREHEPMLALDGGEDGLIFYRGIVRNFINALKLGGEMAFEVGIGQAEEVEALLRQAGFGATRILNDYAGIGRVVAGRLK